MENKTLFRKEVLERKINTDYGVVFLNLPNNYLLITIFLILSSICLIIFLTKCKISEKYRIQGYINSQLIAEMNIPSGYSDFLKINDSIFIHFDDYPSLKFGKYQAKIIALNKRIFKNKDTGDFFVFKSYYKAEASLQKNTIKIYGEEKQIESGMTFSVFIQGKQRTVFQWVFDPFFGFYGKLF